MVNLHQHVSDVRKRYVCATGNWIKRARNVQSYIRFIIVRVCAEPLVTIEFGLLLPVGQQRENGQAAARTHHAQEHVTNERLARYRFGPHHETRARAAFDNDSRARFSCI